MKLPKQIKVGAYDYHLSWKPDLRDDRDNLLFGQVDYGSRTIFLHEKLQKDLQLAVDTLLHEIIHTLYRHFNLPQKTTEERVCESVGTGLMMVMKDNPKLTKAIVEGLYGSK